MSREFTCEVQYHFTGINESRLMDRILKNKMINWYLELRDVIVERTNPMIDAWNEEFDQTFGDVDLTEDSKMSRIYEEFMKEKYDAIMVEYDNTIAKHFKMRYEPDKDFVGIYKKGWKEATIFMTITNMKAV